MDTDINKDKKEDVVSPEEQTAETEALQEVKEEEIKAKITEEFGINEEDEPELFKKLFDKEKSHHEKLSGAIKQKISWREKAKASKTTQETPDEVKDHGKKGDPVNVDELVDQKFNEKWEAKELEALGLPEELQTEVKDLAKLKGISVREAAKLPYILNRKEEIEKAKRLEDATPVRKNKGSYALNIDPSKPLNPEDFDLDTEEGRKRWNEAKEAKKKFNAQGK